MKVCDICREKQSSYTPYVTTKPDGDGKTMDMCGRCYELFYKAEKKHQFLAYQETVELVTNKPIKKTWWQRLKFWRKQYET